MNSPFVMVIFGATGDLARNKLIPALFSLYKKGELGNPPGGEARQFYIIGFARRPLSDGEFRLFLNDQSHYNDINHQSERESFLKNIYYQQGLFDEKRGYEELIQRLNTFDKKIGACITRLFYLATPPDNYESILDYLNSTKLSEGCGSYFAQAAQGGMAHLFTRLIVEKPFGKDLETARALDKKLSDIFEEKQIFRVDHYLGKETVQNMIAFRFANGIFEPVWSKQHIDHVQITWGEKKGIGGRGKFFDGVGLLRDVAQNHLMQLVAAVAMEQPASFSKEGVRDARAKAIKAVRCIRAHEVSKNIVRGQYIGYKQEKDVVKDSRTETFAAIKLFVDTPRFEGVPFYIRAGKKMPKDVVEINIVFIQTCHILFKEFGCPEEGNILTIRIQPDEGIGIRVIAKKPAFAAQNEATAGKPGSLFSLKTVDMSFSYQDEFGGRGADAYEKILLDILHGDQMLFNRSDELESSWEFITEILNGWFGKAESPPPLFEYQENTWGPKEAFDLIEKDGRKWVLL